MAKGGNWWSKRKSRKVTIDDLTLNKMDEENLVLGEEVVIVDIEDTGNRHSSRNFETKYSIHSSPLKEERGTGLGLPIVRNIVSLHKGKLTIQNMAQVESEVDFS